MTEEHIPTREEKIAETLQKTKSYLSEHSAVILSRGSVYLAIIALALGSIFYIDSALSEPTAREIAPDLKDFLMKDGQGECKDGIFSISSLSDITLGTYNEHYKAWPVYGTFSASCQAEKFFFTRNVRPDRENSEPLAFVRKRGLGHQLFVPKSASEVKEDVTQDIKDSFNSIF